MVLLEARGNFPFELLFLLLNIDCLPHRGSACPYTRGTLYDRRNWVTVLVGTLSAPVVGPSSISVSPLLHAIQLSLPLPAQQRQLDGGCL